jgi:hypothetical protein
MDRPAFVTGKILIVLEATEYANYNDRARFVLSWLRNRDPDLTAAETMEVLQQLSRAGRLGEVLHLIGYPELRQFLLKKEITWAFIQFHWEPGFEDSSRFLIGYVRGAAESALDGLLFLAYLVRHTVVDMAATVAEKTGVLDEATAKAIQREPQAFFGALHEFLSDPLIHLAKGVETLKADMEKAFWNLDFLEAGRLFGQITLMILTLPTAIQSVWKLAKLGIKALQAAIPIARLTFQAFTRTAKVSMAQLASFMDGPRPALVTNAGTVLAQSGEDVLILNSAGEALGQIKLSEILEGLQEAAKGSPGMAEISKPNKKPSPPKSALQEQYASRSKTIYPDKLWKYITQLEERFPKLEKLKLRPWKRPKTAEHWAFYERMSADQGSYSLVGKVNGVAFQLDDLSPEGFILDTKFRTHTPFELVDEAAEVVDAIEANKEVLETTRRAAKAQEEVRFDIVDQMRRQLEVSQTGGLRGVIWQTNSHEYVAFLENLIEEFHLSVGEHKVYVTFVP